MCSVTSQRHATVFAEMHYAVVRGWAGLFLSNRSEALLLSYHEKSGDRYY